MEKIRTLFVSDVHLGTHKSKPDKLLEVFRDHEFETLVIVGDFVDLTSMRKKLYWKEDHSTVIQKVLRMSRKGTRVVYVLGNHDHYLRGLLDGHPQFSIGSIDVVDEYLHVTKSGERVYVCHGDQFDGLIRLHPVLYRLGDFAYEFSFMANKALNFMRRMVGMDEWSLSAFLKTRVKNVVSFLTEFQKMAVDKLKDVNCDSIMIGHTHTPAVTDIDGKRYYNTGDFCETCSYIVEDMEGKLTLRHA